MDTVRQSGLLGSRPGLVCLISGAVLISLVVSGMVFAELLEYELDDGWLGTDVDIALSDYAVAHRRGWLTRIMRQVTDLGGTPALTAVALSITAIMLLLRRIRLAAVMMIAAIGSSALTVTLKTIIERPRPITNGEIIFASDSSFPSGHTLESAAIYGALVIIVGSLIASRRIRIGVWAIGASIAIGVGASRVYLGVHWALGGRGMAAPIRADRWNRRADRAGPARHAFLTNRLPGTNPRGTKIDTRRHLSGRGHSLPR